MRTLILLIFIAIFSQIAFAQTSLNRYEVEMFKNPHKGKKDTREVNSVIVFEKDSVKIISRRSSEVFKEFKYSEIQMVEHSFSKNPLFASNQTRDLVLAALLGSPFLYAREEKHWLTILGESDFVVLKLENDNFRLIKMEFAVKKIEVENVNEDRQ